MPYVPDFTRPQAVLGSVVGGRAVTVDVTAAFQTGPGLKAIAIRNASANGAHYGSRDRVDQSQRPRLELGS